MSLLPELTYIVLERRSFLGLVILYFGEAELVIFKCLWKILLLYLRLYNYFNVNLVAVSEFITE